MGTTTATLLSVEHRSSAMSITSTQKKKNKNDVKEREDTILEKF